MSTRVIAGKAKGRRLKLVPGETTRPIMDRVKEALFNIIGQDILDSAFLDLFAGTGSVGIEALSRGAAHARFLDTERLAIKTIQENLRETRLESQALVQQLDAFQFLQKSPDRCYDYVYIAPPQYQGLWLKTLHLLDANPGWMNPEASVIVQIDPTEREPLTLKYLTEEDERRYGNTLLLFMRHPMMRESEPPED